jgi:uracil-DNA glycosylase family 4
MIGSRGEFWRQIRAIRNPRCTLCPLHKTEGNVCVTGRGTAWAPIILIGEAPGEAEARTGQPFMGRAGQLLNELLRDNMMSHLVYITNIAKCRPPENRKPTPSEMRTCGIEYLGQELGVLDPKVTVLLGKTPIEYFFGKKPFKRGVVYDLAENGSFLVSYQGKDPHQPTIPCIIPTWHPAYIIHSNSTVARDQLRSHLLRAKELVV